MSNVGRENLGGGEFTPKIDVRTDTEKYISGCRRLENMIPTVYGPVTRRPGTTLISISVNLEAILAAIISFGNIGVCHENEAVSSLYDSSISIIFCYENDIVCHENEIISSSEAGFITQGVCHENELVFYENETVVL